MALLSRTGLQMHQRTCYLAQPVALPKGIRYIPKFLEAGVEERVVEQSRHLYQAIQSQIKQAKHDPTSMEFYKRVEWKNERGNSHGIHFERHGEKGHQFTYFFKLCNTPQFVEEELISKIKQMDDVQMLERSAGPLHWKFTFNTYAPPEISELPPFSFRQNEPYNGDTTAIYTLLQSAILEMKRVEKSDPYSLVLTPGSLVILRGEARQEWYYRMVPSQNEGMMDKEIRRMSLILGAAKGVTKKDSQS